MRNNDNPTTPTVAITEPLRFASLRDTGTDDEMAHSSLRLGIGRFTTEAEIDLAVELLEKHVNRCDDDEMHMKSTQYLTELLVSWCNHICCYVFCVCAMNIDAGAQVARHVAPVGDGAGGHRPEEHPVVAGQRPPPPLIRFIFEIVVCLYVC